MRLRIAAPEDVALTAVLEGCPGDLVDDQKIEILNNGGYEHFERVEQSSEFGPGSSATFQWVMRTKIAE